MRSASTLDQIASTAADHLKRALGNPVHTYEDTGRRDIIGNPVYARHFQGVLDGYVAVRPFVQYRKHVREIAAAGQTAMGVPKLYRPVDPDTGDYFGRRQA